MTPREVREATDLAGTRSADVGRKKLSEHPPEVAAAMRADLAAKKRAAWAAGKYAERANGAQRREVAARIAAVVKERWDAGDYAGRVNGMTGRTGSRSSNWTWGAREYRAILEAHESPACVFCGTTETLNVHHVDEDHANYLITNLLWVCVPCLAWQFHYESRGTTHVKRPFITIHKKFKFEYAHVLPWHPGKCARLHGHSGHLGVTVRGRIDPNDVVMDFYDLGAAVKDAVVEPLDHQMLNDFVANPTSEALLIWIWRELEGIGLKGLTAVEFAETDSSTSSITASDMVEAFGWDRLDGDWTFVPKTAPVEGAGEVMPQ